MQCLRSYLPGLFVVTLITIASMFGAQFGLSRFGLSPLSLAIILGVVLGNLHHGLGQGQFQVGLRFSQKTLLRTGVALYGFNLSIQQVAHVGMQGIGVDLVMVCSTLLLGLYVGRRILGLDHDAALLIATGSAICGAAAVVATVPTLKMSEEEGVNKTAAAVASVVLFGTLAMIVYPLLYAWFGSMHSFFGIYVGSTVHEVAQVVAIGNIIGHGVAADAIIVKMIRVMLLVPFLLIVSGLSQRTTDENDDNTGTCGHISVPWFAIAFILCAAINSLPFMPQVAANGLRLIATLLLSAAMAALGIDTTLRRLRQTGPRAMLLGGILFLHLVVVGGLINSWLG
jgi:uncharacterized integral membrane protein (TIGR00698 family)